MRNRPNFARLWRMANDWRRNDDRPRRERRAAIFAKPRTREQCWEFKLMRWAKRHTTLLTGTAP